ncbi:hypothetical protein BS78_02G146500 [Paspalum vaginatum]|nr:hypothetical protein BS78_02G146500 [Paspalum vaginatum]
MSFILSCDFSFCCGSPSDHECQPPPPPPPRPPPTPPVYAPQTQIIEFLPQPPQAVPPTIVYPYPPPGITPSPHVRNGKGVLPPVPNMEQPAWPSTPPASHVPSSIVPQSAKQQPIMPHHPIDDLPSQSPRMIPSDNHQQSGVIQPSNTYHQTPSITNQQQLAPPNKVASKVHGPLQQSTNGMDQEQPPEAIFPARQQSKTYQNLTPMNQKSLPPHAPSRRYETSLQAVAQTEPSRDAIAKPSIEYYSETHREYILKDGCQEYY